MTTLPRFSSRVVVEQFDDGAVVFDPSSARSARLDSSAVALIAWLDGVTDREELVTELTAGGVVDAEAWLDSAVKALRDACLLDADDDVAGGPDG